MFLPTLPWDGSKMRSEVLFGHHRRSISGANDARRTPEVKFNTTTCSGFDSLDPVHHHHFIHFVTQISTVTTASMEQATGCHRCHRIIVPSLIRRTCPYPSFRTALQPLLFYHSFIPNCGCRGKLSPFIEHVRMEEILTDAAFISMFSPKLNRPSFSC